MLRFVVGMFAFLGWGCGASDAPHQLPGPALVASATVAPVASSPITTSAVASSSQLPPSTDPKAPSSARKAIGVYWNASAKEEEERLNSYAALAIDEEGVMWMFARRDRKNHGFVVRHDGGTERASLDVVYPAQLPKGFTASRWSLEGSALLEITTEGVTRRARDNHAALAPPALPALWVGLEGARAEVAMLGPLLIGRGMGRTGDDCWMGILLPEPPWRKSATRDERRVGVRVIGDSLTYGVGGKSSCAMSALPRDGLVKVEGNLTDGHLVADARGPAVFLAVGYMSAAAFVPRERRDDPALRKLLESEVGTAAE